MWLCWTKLSWVTVLLLQLSHLSVACLVGGSRLSLLQKCSAPAAALVRDVSLLTCTLTLVSMIRFLSVSECLRRTNE